MSCAAGHQPLSVMFYWSTGCSSSTWWSTPGSHWQSSQLDVNCCQLAAACYKYQLVTMAHRLSCHCITGTSRRPALTVAACWDDCCGRGWTRHTHHHRSSRPVGQVYTVHDRRGGTLVPRQRSLQWCYRGANRRGRYAYIPPLSRRPQPAHARPYSS